MGSSRMVWEPDQRLSLHGIRVQDPPGEPEEAAVTDPGWAELGPHAQSSLCTGRGVAQGETISSSRAAANGLACWPVARKKNDWKLWVMPSVMCQLDWAARHPVFGYAASGRSVRVFRVRLAFESTKE